MPVVLTRPPIRGTAETGIVTIQKKGSLFIIGGRYIELFPVSVMAEAVFCKHGTFRRYESQYGFPPSSFRLSEDQAVKRRLWMGEKARLYSVGQVQLANFHFWRVFQGRRFFGAESTRKIVEAVDAIKLHFYKVGLEVDPQRGIIRWDDGAEVWNEGADAGNRTTAG